MSKIVVLSTFYIDKPSANGICARNLVMALQNAGHDVEVICYSTDVCMDRVGLEVIHTVPPIVNKNKKGVRKYLSFAKGLITPNMDSKLVDNYYKTLCEINRCCKINMIIAMFFPIESLQAAVRFKSKHKNIIVCSYELDSIVDGVYHIPLQALNNASYERWLNRMYSVADKIFCMSSHERYWVSRYGKRYQKKMVLVDLPVLTKREVYWENVKPCSMIYTGILEKAYRSPTYMLNVFEKLAEYCRYSMTFYSKGDCEEEIRDTAKRVGCIYQKGYVSPEELDNAMRQASAFISLGNAVSRSVPSKLINYFSYGKPIIHFSLQDEDVCIDYLDKYPLALVVNASTPVEESTKRIVAFLQDVNSKSVPIEYILKTYKLHNPAYSALLITEVLGRDKSI